MSLQRDHARSCTVEGRAILHKPKTNHRRDYHEMYA